MNYGIFIFRLNSVFTNEPSKIIEINAKSHTDKPVIEFTVHVISIQVLNGYQLFHIYHDLYSSLFVFL